MVQNLKLKILFIIAVLIGAACVMYFKDITLGLDLSGGSSLRYKLPRPDDLGDKPMKEVLEDTLEVFRKRVQGYGLKEIPIRGQGDDEITIELPGMSEAQANDIINIIQSQGQLEWLIVAETESDTEDQSISINEEEKRDELIAYIKQLEEQGKGWNLDVDLSSLNFSLTLNERKAYYRWVATSEDSLIKNEIPVPKAGSTFESLGLSVDSAPEQINRYFKLIKKYEDQEWQFSGQDLESVFPSYDRLRNPAVGFELKPARAADFGNLTKNHIGKRLAIILDGKLNTDPVINSEIPGSGIISGPEPKGFALNEQKALLTILRSGSLDVKPVLLARNTIGPTLGNNAINRGKIAALIGLGSVFVFLIIYYLFAGTIASIALAVNLLLLMGVMIFLEATLTLPGIAAIVLTVGMAVDANILIFERIREEKDKGKTLAQSIKNGFERAFITIVDANATTFITGFILFQFGTGPIKGFAATLMIGICTSLFAALIVSKVIFALLIEKGWIKELKMLRFLKEPNIGFLAAMPPAGVCSLVVIIAGLVGFFMADQGKYGLDFTGGYNIHLKCEEGTTQAEVQNKLGTVFPNVQVVTIEKGLETRESDPYQSFDIKIKSTVSAEEAIRAEEEALRTGAPTEIATLSTEEGTTGSFVVGSSEYYLNKIKELLAEDLIKDPIYNLELIPNEENQTTEVHFVMNLSDPSDQPTLERAFGNLLQIKKVEMEESGLTAHISAIYTKGTAINKTWLQGRISARMKQANQDEGIPVVLSDPFPLTGYIGPTVGHQLRDKAIIAIFFSLIAIIVYIRVRFKEYKYGFAAAVALVHDVLITLGAVTVARSTGLVDVEIDLPLIAAFLTIIGYSLNDTIVVFDRIRENLPRINLPFRNLVNFSINQTLSRTVLTSATTLLTVIILFVLNYGQRNVMEGFSFALIVGVLVGTYSSIFVASPVLMWLHHRVESAAAPGTSRPRSDKNSKSKKAEATKTGK